jgi:hypothetical protein
VVATVEEMLRNMEANREDAAMEYMVKLDKWSVWSTTTMQ